MFVLEDWDKPSWGRFIVTAMQRTPKRKIIEGGEGGHGVLLRLRENYVEFRLSFDIQYVVHSTSGTHDHSVAACNNFCIPLATAEDSQPVAAAATAADNRRHSRGQSPPPPRSRKELHAVLFFDLFCGDKSQLREKRNQFRRRKDCCPLLLFFGWGERAREEGRGGGVLTSHVKNDVTPDGEYKDSKREEFHKKIDAIFSKKRLLHSFAKRIPHTF